MRRQNGVSVAGTDRNGEIHDMLYVDDLLVSPFILEDVLEDLDGLIPNEPVVPLAQGRFSCRYAARGMLRTSEKAGATILRWCFHSSPSVAMMFVPNALSSSYGSVSFWKRARDPIRSYRTNPAS